MPVSLERIAVLGAGSWGATLAALLCDKGHSVSLWEIDPKAAEALRTTRHLPVLPDLRLPAPVEVTSDMSAALKGRPLIVSVTPSQFVRSTMRAARTSGAVEPGAFVISASKGLEDKTLKRMSEIITEELSLSPHQIGILAGPSHAEEVCRHLPTAVVIATLNKDWGTRARNAFTQDYFRVYGHEDVVGVELGGPLKNLFAIACGISDGLGLGDNTKAAIMTRGLNEMTRIGSKLGAQVMTFFGLAGMGDLIVTCLSQHSRNRLLGEKIGKGKSPKDALAELTMVSEGYQTAPAAYDLVKRLQLDCPLTREIYHVLYEGKNPNTSLRDLMARDAQSEWSNLK